METLLTQLGKDLLIRWRTVTSSLILRSGRRLSRLAYLVLQLRAATEWAYLQPHSASRHKQAARNKSKVDLLASGMP
jgi:hypothetical protein